MIYATAKFAVAMSNDLVGDSFTRNLTDGRTDGPGTYFDTNLIYPFFLKKKVGITVCKTMDNLFSSFR